MGQLRKCDAQNYDTLLNAAKSECRKLALLPSIRKDDGSDVDLICEIHYDIEKDEYFPVPLAIMIKGDPFESFENPFEYMKECLESR